MMRAARRSSFPQLASVEPPSAARLRMREGPVAVIKASWRDPDDVHASAARVPKSIDFYRQFCPLRRINRQAQGNARTPTFGERALWAADRLRLQADITAFGFSPMRDERPVNALCYGPRTGPNAADVLREITSREFRRAMLRFTEKQRLMLTDIILLNRSLASWCESSWQGPGPPSGAYRLIAMGMLRAIVEILEDHYAGEIDDAIAHGDIIVGS